LGLNAHLTFCSILELNPVESSFCHRCFLVAHLSLFLVSNVSLDMFPFSLRCLLTLLSQALERSFPTRPPLPIFPPDTCFRHRFTYPDPARTPTLPLLTDFLNAFFRDPVTSPHLFPPSPLSPFSWIFQPSLLLLPPPF